MPVTSSEAESIIFRSSNVRHQCNADALHTDRLASGTVSGSVRPRLVEDLPVTKQFYRVRCRMGSTSWSGRAWLLMQ